MKQLFSTILLLITFCAAGLAQERFIAGTVSDGTYPLPGVSVLIKDTTTGTVTGIDGEFKLSVPAGATTLEVRFVGYKTQLVEIGNQTNFEITLEEDLLQLQEVVVDGYSSQDVKKMTSTVAVVDATALEQRPVPTFEQALQGQVAGVQVNMNSKAPGAAASVKIRGTGSLAGANQALFIVDGVQVDGRTFATLNPNDFSSYQVLKDASAVAMYGSRGANGVVVVTTKAGSEKATLKLNSYMGFAEATTNGFDMMDSEQREQFEEMIQDGPTYAPGSYGYMLQEPNTDVTSNWFDEFYRTGITQSHQLSLSGGDDDSKYYISGNYFTQEGVVRKTGMERGTVRMNLSQKMGRLDVDLRTQVGIATIDNIYRNDAYNVLTMLPYYQSQDENGEYLPLDYNGSNAFERIDKGENSSSLLGIVSSLKLTYELTDFLKVWSRTGVEYDQERTKDAISPNSLYANLTPGDKGSLSVRNYQDYLVTGTSALQFDKSFGDHTISAGIFQEYILEDGITEGFDAYGFTDVVSPALHSPDIFQPSVTGAYDKRFTQMSYFANVDYDYKGKYILRGVYRRDGTSVFGENKKWGDFYSIGAGWVLSDEAFLQDSELIDNLKLRVSYGTVGNQGAISRYGSLATLSPISYNGRAGLYRDKPSNPDLQWEVSKQLNAGVDFALFGGKLGGSINYYNNNSFESFINTPLPYTSGFSSQTRNNAHLNNQGVELTLNSEFNLTQDLRVSLFANLTRNQSKAVELNEEGVEYRGVGQLQVDELANIEGEQLFLARAYDKVGVDPATGRLLFRNSDGSIVDDINQAERIVLGTTEAPWFGGFGTTFTWKGLELRALFNWEQGATKLNWDRVEIERVLYADQNHSTKLLDSWQKPGDISAYPKAESGQALFATTDHWEDASFLRLKNLSLAYTLPQTWTKKLGVEKARFYAQGENLYTFTSFTGIDPEMSTAVQSTNNGTGSTNVNNAYPLSKVLTFGVDLTF
ncbi:SusC/RagA family TonB-linked outer membrane protein [Sediminitomix flava]|uniref:TonB-linked SusC/RagA family outer membrane protein n=1 Tax=Sediminitomix flava TaxID=379075 RepID=A0A315ZU98_SEDFL|nr:SusC/RagA family TonB-linked outer membrane protein [Sediminitomix flava]PWJ39209.1 TonB-linked SusC/RagA family outer membrane protein [Sediminitomix flava]